MSNSIHHKETKMPKKKCHVPITSQLHCKSTAALDNQIAEDLCQPDKPLTDVLADEVKDKQQDAQEQE